MWSIAFVLAFCFFLLLGDPLGSFDCTSPYEFLACLCLLRIAFQHLWDGEDMVSSSSKVISSSVATTMSVAQSMFTISTKTLSQVFSQALGHSLPQILAAFQSKGETSSTSSSSTTRSRGDEHASNLAASITPNLSSISGNVVVPSFISAYSTVGNPMVSAVAQLPFMALSLLSSFVSHAWASSGTVSMPLTFISPACPLTGTSPLTLLVGKAFVVGPSYAREHLRA